MLQEEMSRKNWPMDRVTAILEGNDDFVQSVNIVVGKNSSKTLGTQIPELKVRTKIILNNNVELKIKYLEENFLSIVWFCCQVSGHATDMISSHDLS